jgi:hypothetical protein
VRLHGARNAPAGRNERLRGLNRSGNRRSLRDAPNCHFGRRNRRLVQLSLKVLFGGGDIDEQEATLLAVHKLLVPLTDAENPVYRDRVVVLIDKPNAKQNSKYELFKNGYPYLYETNRVFEIPHHSLEEYYPAPFGKTADEVKGFAKEKVPYARKVGAEITKEQFEKMMPVLADALHRSVECAFGGE